MSAMMKMSMNGPLKSLRPPSGQFLWRASLCTIVFVIVILWALPYTGNDASSSGKWDVTSPWGYGLAPESKLPESSPSESKTAAEEMKSDNRPLILYAYAESERARENFNFFLAKALHGRADFIFIFNGETNASDLVPKNLPNVRVVKRPNSCFDLGAFGEVLKKDNLWKQYKRFITVNASVRGPFFPVYAAGMCWSDVFLSRLSDKIKLVGTTFNCEPRAHVQSMLMATDDIGMGILLDEKLAYTIHNIDVWGGLEDPVGLGICHKTMDNAVHAEIGNTELIRSQGYEVTTMLAAFNAASDPSKYCDEFGNPPDVLYDGKYFGTTIHPYESIFFKANRDLAPVTLEKLTEWHLKMQGDSWGACGR